MPAKKTAPAKKAAPAKKKTAPKPALPVVDESVDLFAGTPPVELPGEPLTLKFKLLHPAVPYPRYATAGAACFDITSFEDAVLLPGGSRSLRTGLAFEVPQGHVLLIFSRSGHGFKHGVRLVNSVGVIDSDYRGEVAVGLKNEGNDVFTVHRGDRVAQGMILPVPWVTLWQTDVLSDTERGEAGFGSTGK